MIDRLALPLISGVLFLPSQLTASDASVLRGLRELPVFIAISEKLETRGLNKEQIRIDTELRLRKAGIRVMPMTGQALLYLMVHLEASCFKQPSSFELCGYNFEISINELATVARDPSIVVVAKTWESRGRVGTFGIERGASSMSTDNQRAFRDDVGDLVDEFVNAYLEANPAPPLPTRP
jgi:hypothetical protein